MSEPSYWARWAPEGLERMVIALRTGRALAEAERCAIERARRAALRLTPQGNKP